MMGLMDAEMTAFLVPRAGAIIAVAAVIGALLIIALRPLLERYALARPNARSSHKTPTPQGGGIAVIAATIVVSAGALLSWSNGDAVTAPLMTLCAATLLMMGVGIMADIHPIDVAPRLLLQTIAVAAVILTLPAELRIFPVLPWWVERIALIVGGLWFVNLVNFMDGLDWMTAAEVVPMTAALGAMGLFGILPSEAIVVSLALCGGMIGFGVFNRPVARIFLGDVGSLPIGLVLGWLLILAAGHGARTAAILLPLYYLADSTITLCRRAINRETLWQAHRSHFYQRATDGGFSVIQVVARVFFINLVLAALALATVLKPSHELDIAAIGAGAALVIWLLWNFARGRR
jgi:UDP-N-acetylmuramyl pentapeptide phosphotransferase/UDP-N-acetylglucosamine-1-phosphate transferase